MYQWLDEAKQNIKKRRQGLFSKDPEVLADLAELFAARSHRVMVLWALDFAAESVAELERELGAELFRRARRGVEPTAAGQALLTGARALLADADALRENIRGMGGKI